MGTWTLDDIPWDRFDKSKISPDLIPIVKAASMVEYNAEDYRHYLNNVFHDDDRACTAINRWAGEEVQHGRALGKWATLADPDFDFEGSFRRFTDNYRVPLDASESVRGSRSGEMIARCMVETGTNSFYSALAEAAKEPVLKAICQRIAADEYAHYCLFHSHMRRYLKMEELSFPERLRVAMGRIAETEDDELASAYWAANRGGESFDRRTNSVDYARGSLPYYRPHHIRRGVEMIFGAIGLNPHGVLGRLATRAARLFIWYRVRFTPRLSMLRARVSEGWQHRFDFFEQGT